MNGRIVWRVMWKEYRTLRGLWVAVALASWGAQISILLSATDLNLLEVAYGAALVTPVFYVFGAAAAVFAGERDDGSDRLLIALPTPLPSLAAGKMAFVALSTLALIPAAGALAVWSLSQATTAPLQLQEGVSSLAFIWAPAILEGFAWGLFFSLLCRNVMQAACLATLAAAATVLIALHLSSSSYINGVDTRQYAETLWPRLGIVLVVLAADVALVRRWLSERSPPTDVAKPGIVPTRTWLARGKEWLSQAVRWQTRLTWQALRQSTATMVLVICLPITFSLLIPRLSERVRIPEISSAGLLEFDIAWEVMLMVLAALVGCTAFAADKRSDGYRCLAEQGCSARTFWFSRQTVALAWLCGAILVWHLAWRLRFGQFGWPLAQFEPFNEYGFRSGDQQAWNLMSGRELAAVAACYAAGQLASLLLTNTLVSMLVGLALAAGFYAWSLLMFYLLLPPALTVWPLAAGLLATTAVFARGWLLDRRGLRTWLRAGATFAAFGAVTLALIPLLRLADVPDPPLAFDVEQFRSTLGPEAQQTAELYRRAVETVRTRREMEDRLAAPDSDAPEGQPPVEAQPTWDPSDPYKELRDLVAANAEPLRLVLEAKQRPECAFVRPMLNLKERRFSDLSQLLYLRGSNRSEADLETRLAALNDLLRMVEHMRPSYESFREATQLEQSALHGFLEWAAMSNQTPQQVRAARRLLEAHPARMAGVDEVVKLQYLELLRDIETAEPQSSFWLDRYLAALPWERTRARRLVKMWANRNLETIDQTVNHTSPAALEVMHGFHRPKDEELALYATPAMRAPLETPVYAGHWLMEEALNRLARARAAIVLLELMAVQLEKKERPASLAELKSEDFPSIPLDPFTGSEFEYFPRGFPVELRQTADLGRSLMEDLNLGRPMLWSPAGKVRMKIEQVHGRPVRQFQHFTGDRWTPLDTDLGGWLAGTIFTVPETIDFANGLPPPRPPLPPSPED